jgi:hypothetical protein
MLIFFEDIFYPLTSSNTTYILDTTEKLTNDYEIQNWANSLVDEEELGLKVNGNHDYIIP